MASFTKWLLDHKVAVICVLVLLMALSVVGTILTDKESDVLSYLDPESDTSIGKQMLNSSRLSTAPLPTTHTWAGTRKTYPNSRAHSKGRSRTSLSFRAMSFG